MWQQRMKAWLDAVRARFAWRGERTTSGDIEAYESRDETIAVGSQGGFDLRRSALPLTIGAIAVLSAVALVPLADRAGEVVDANPDLAAAHALHRRVRHEGHRLSLIHI